MEPSEARSELYKMKHELDDILRSKQEEKKRAWGAARLASLETEKLERAAARLTKRMESLKKKLNYKKN